MMHLHDLYRWMDQSIRAIVGLMDRHDGALMVLLTGLLVFFAYKSAKIALKNLEIIKENDNKRTLPYVTLEVVNDMPFYGVKMVNLGATSAHNIVVKSEPRIEMLFPNYKKPIKFLHEPVSYLAPSAHFETDIGSFGDIEKANPAKLYAGTIGFENDEGKKFEQEFVLDFSPFDEAIHKDVKTVHDIAVQLEELKKELVNIGTGIHKPHVLREEYEGYCERIEKCREKQRREKEAEQASAGENGVMKP